MKLLRVSLRPEQYLFCCFLVFLEQSLMTFKEARMRIALFDVIVFLWNPAP
jgi:hypothetical protein